MRPRWFLKAGRRLTRSAVLVLAGVIISGCSGPSQTEEPAVYENIRQAAFYGNITAVKGFLEEGVSINEPAASGAPLHNAIENNQVAMVEFLLENGADATMRRARILSDEAPIHTAAGAGYYRIVELLVLYGADVNAPKSIGNISGLTPLHETVLARQVEEGHLKTAQVLLENGANVNARAVMGRESATPLNAALERGQSEMAALLRQYGGRE